MFLIVASPFQLLNDRFVRCPKAMAGLVEHPGSRLWQFLVLVPLLLSQPVLELRILDLPVISWQFKETWIDLGSNVSQLDY